MPSTNLSGPFPLTRDIVNSAVYGIGPGAYALGHIDQSRNFVIERIGRSDKDLNGRLRQHVGTYSVFKFSFFDSAILSYHKECSLYHDFRPRDNKFHPNCPVDEDLVCPVCGT